jgi:redox-sensitive bicupin YhaK (pirin superfamily)
VPDRRGHTPRYGSRRFTAADRHNTLLQLRGPEGGAHGAIGMHQDANVYVTEIDAGAAVSLALAPRRQLYIVCAEGAATAASDGAPPVALNTRDAAEFVHTTTPTDGGGGGAATAATVTLTAGGAGAHCMLIEMAAAAG